MSAAKAPSGMGWDSEWFHTGKPKAELPPLPPTPWVSGIAEQGVSDQAGERQRWRDDLRPFIQAIEHDLKRSEAVFFEEYQKINTMARAVTMVDPSMAGQRGAMSASRMWAIWDGAGAPTFDGAKPSPKDRKELLRWLGQGTARSNWRNAGSGSYPMVVSAAGLLMTHWVGIAWRGLDTPDWARAGIEAADQTVYPTPHPRATDLFRPWAEARADMSAFLDGWHSERIVMGRRRPRRCSERHSNRTAALDMDLQLLLLRALEVLHPGSVGRDNLVAIKELGRLVETPSVDTALRGSLCALEDRAHLEKGLEKIPEADQPVGPSHRRTL